VLDGAVGEHRRCNQTGSSIYLPGAADGGGRIDRCMGRERSMGARSHTVSNGPPRGGEGNQTEKAGTGQDDGGRTVTRHLSSLQSPQAVQLDLPGMVQACAQMHATTAGS
jgi:hypothetical protein